MHSVQILSKLIGMARKRIRPRLRIDGAYYVAKIYTPEGRRTSISFGHVDERPESDVRAAFAKWLELYELHPVKLLSFGNPYEAVRQIVSPSSVATVGELMAKYLRWAETSLRPTREGNENPDLAKVRRAKESLRAYESWPTGDFGPDELRKVQAMLVRSKYKAGNTDKHYTRRGVNDTINVIRSAWRWGLGRGLVKTENVQILNEVRALRVRQDNVHENQLRGRITEEEFHRVLTATNPVVGDMLRLIWHTAMRPYEVCNMRPCDLLVDDPECWLYVPGRERSPLGDHKTVRFDRIKVIPLTKAAQDILKPRIERLRLTEYVFRPEEAVRGVKHLRVKCREKYDHNSLCRACKRACQRAGVKVFVPYDLRRTAATGTRSLLGKEAAKLLLGHMKTDTTDLYLLEEVQEVIKVAKLLDARM